MRPDGNNTDDRGNKAISDMDQPAVSCSRALSNASASVRLSPADSGLGFELVTDCGASGITVQVTLRVIQ